MFKFINDCELENVRMNYSYVDFALVIENSYEIFSKLKRNIKDTTSTLESVKCFRIKTEDDSLFQKKEKKNCIQ